MTTYKIKRFASLASHVKNAAAGGAMVGGALGTISGGPLGGLAGGITGGLTGAAAGIGTKLGEMGRNGLRKLRGKRRVAEQDYIDDMDNSDYEQD